MDTDPESAAPFLELHRKYRANLTAQLADTDAVTRARLDPLLDLALDEVIRLCPMQSVPVWQPAFGLRHVCAPTMPHPEGVFVIGVTPQASLSARLDRWPAIQPGGGEVTQERLDGLLWGAMARFIDQDNLDGLLVMATARLGSDGTEALLDSFRYIRDHGHIPVFILCVDCSQQHVVGMALPLPLPPSVESYYRVGDL